MTAEQAYIAKREAYRASLDEQFGKSQWSLSLWMDQYPRWDELTEQQRQDWSATHDR